MHKSSHAQGENVNVTAWFTQYGDQDNNKSYQVAYSNCYAKSHELHFCATKRFQKQRDQPDCVYGAA